MLARRHAITLVEVIVIVLMIVAILAMLVPVILKAREAYNASVCSDRLRAIVIASHDYHGDFYRLPSGYYSAVKENGYNTHYAEDRGPHVGVLVVLLPYLNNDSIFKKVCNTAAVWPTAMPELAGTSPLNIDMQTEYAAWWKQPQNLLVAKERLEVFQCPSDNLYADGVTTGIVSLQVGNDAFAYISLPGAQELGRTNYVGVAGMVGAFDLSTPLKPKNGRYPDAESWGRDTDVIPKSDWDHFAGCLYNRSKLTLGQITVRDGTSNTLFFGEALGGMGKGDRKTAFTWFGAGALGTAYGLGYHRLAGFDGASPPPLGSQPAANTSGATWFRFSSRHAGIVKFITVAGNITSIRIKSTAFPDLQDKGINSSDWSFLQQFAGWRDGNPQEVVALPE